MRRFAMVLLLCLLLSACATPEPTEPPTEPPMTAERLVQEMLTATAANPMTSSTVDMEMGITVAAEGVTMEMNMDMTSVNMVSLEPYAGYSELTMTMDMLGEQTTETTRQYMMEQDGAIVSYMNVDGTSSWEKLVMDLNLEQLMQESQDYNYLTQAAAEELQLAESTQLLDGQEVYVLSIDLKGTQMQDALSSMDSLYSLLSETGMDFDFSALTVPTTYYIDVATYLPVKMEMDIQGMGEMMTGMIGSMLGGAAAGMEIDIPTFKAVYSQMGYGPAEIPAVPAEGKLKADQVSFNPDQGDGTYIIQESGSAVKITCPEGWTATEMGYDNLTLEKDDGSKSVTYNMWTGIAGGYGFVSRIERGDILGQMEAGNYGSHGNTTLELDGNSYGALWVKCNDGSRIYYAWDQIGAETNYILVKTVDKTGSSMEDSLADVLSFVEEYQLIP
ncbi:MAG: hypothetical protein IKT52_05225 [Oscillospiraceae bacterium]|nr:hypothetical protein [Oscillospiraceae bacterium]